MTDPRDDACYTLRNEKTAKEVILTREHMRIILCSLAGFELSREERMEIKTEYLELLELHTPGTVRPEALKR